MTIIYSSCLRKDSKPAANASQYIMANFRKEVACDINNDQVIDTVILQTVNANIKSHFIFQRTDSHGHHSSIKLIKNKITYKAILKDPLCLQDN